MTGLGWFVLAVVIVKAMALLWVFVHLFRWWQEIREMERRQRADRDRRRNGDRL